MQVIDAIGTPEKFNCGINKMESASQLKISNNRKTRI